MSNYWLAKVWEEKTTKGSVRLVLLALADIANDQGYCWPSFDFVARKTNLSKRFVIQIVLELEQKGLLSKRKRFDRDGDYTSNMYLLNVGVVKDSSLPVVNPSSLPSELEDTTGSELEDTTVVNPSSLKPSFNPQIEPSLTGADGEPVGQLGKLQTAFYNASRLPSALSLNVADVKIYEAFVKGGVTPEDIKWAVELLLEKYGKQGVICLRSIVNTVNTHVAERLRGENAPELAIAADGRVSL